MDARRCLWLRTRDRYPPPPPFTNKIMTTETLELIQVEPSELYKPGALRAVIDKIKKEAFSIVPDVTTEKGRKEVASLAYKIAQTKTKIDNIGKELGDEHRDTLNRINADRKLARGELDQIKADVRQPLTEFEEQEKQRVQGHEDIISGIRGLADCEYLESKPLLETIAQLKTRDLSTLQEFTASAELAREKSLASLGKTLEILQAQEEQAAELAKLKKEAADREQKEREERIAKEAEEKAKREAAEKAEAEAQAVAQREREFKAEAEKKLRELEEAHRRTLKDKADAEAAIEAAKIKKEADMKAAEADREAEERKRKGDEEHIARIKSEIAADLKGKKLAEAIEAIFAGQIRHVSVKI